MSLTGKHPNGVLFDLDGTLVDSSYQHTIAWWHAFRDAGVQVPMREIHRAIGMGADSLVPHLIERQDDDLSTAHDHYYAPYLEQVQVFEGAADLLRACRGLGLTVVLASSSEESQLQRLRRALAADDAIDHVTTGSDVDQSKPAPDLIELALQRASLQPHEAVMVGDTKWDVESAGKAGVPCVALMSGGWDAQELRAAGAVEVWESPQALLIGLKDSLIASLSVERV